MGGVTAPSSDASAMGFLFLLGLVCACTAGAVYCCISRKSGKARGFLDFAHWDTTDEVSPISRTTSRVSFADEESPSKSFKSALPGSSAREVSGGNVKADNGYAP